MDANEVINSSDPKLAAFKTLDITLQIILM